MLGFKEKEKIQKWLKDQIVANNLSFALQKEEIVKKYPEAFFAEENQTLSGYIEHLLENFPKAMIESKYILDSLEYLYQQENHYLISPTKELYPIIAKKHATNPIKIERSIRYFITKYFLTVDERFKTECFSIPEREIPTNFLFLINLVDYIKANYYTYSSVTLPEEQKKYFFSHLKQENNAMHKIQQAKLKLEIERFLIENLGHFKYQASTSQFLLIDLILYCMENYPTSIQEFYEEKEINQKWKLDNQKYFSHKMNGLSFLITNAHPFINPEVYQKIFGDTTLHRRPFEYIIMVSD